MSCVPCRKTSAYYLDLGQFLDELTRVCVLISLLCVKSWTKNWETVIWVNRMELILCLQHFYFL